MSLLKGIKFVLFTFPDNTHFVVRTTLNTTLAPKMREGCVFDLDRNINIPLSELEEASFTLHEDYPEEYREESKFYEELRYGIREV